MDGMGLKDSVTAELNQKPTRAEQLGMRFGRPRIPARPDEDASWDDWVAYAVALGADRTYLTEMTAHYDEAAGKTYDVPQLTKDQVIDLAGCLGG